MYADVRPPLYKEQRLAYLAPLAGADRVDRGIHLLSEVDDLDQLVGLEVLHWTFIREVGRPESIVQQRLAFARHLSDEVTRTVVIRQHEAVG